MVTSIFIPVRLQSERLPKKALKKINGKPIIQYLIERLQKIRNIDNVVICTTNNSSDDELIEFLKENNFSYFRGSNNDILDRFLKTTQKFQTDFIIAIDGDDIYCDPDYVEKILTEFKKHDADCYHITGAPVGFTPLGFKTSTLEKICSIKNTTNTETGYGRFFFNTQLFKIHEIHVKLKTSFPKNLRMSLDYQIDFEIAQKIFNKFGNNFHIEDILIFLSKNPEILKELIELQIKWDQHWDSNLSDMSIRDM